MRVLNLLLSLVLATTGFALIWLGGQLAFAGGSPFYLPAGLVLVSVAWLVWRWELSRGPHALRATAATSALEHNADIAKVQEWLGHASISTTRVYDRRGSKPEDSPTFRVTY